jgi:hypothetical protein
VTAALGEGGHDRYPTTPPRGGASEPLEPEPGRSTAQSAPDSQLPFPAGHAGSIPVTRSVPVPAAVLPGQRAFFSTAT